MQIPKFISSLFPTLERARIVTDLEDLKTELERDTLPAFRTGVEDFGSRKLVSEFNKRMDASVKSEFKGTYRGNYLNAVNQVLLVIAENIPLMQRLTNETKAPEILRDAIELPTATLLQWLASAQFVTRYARRLLMACLITETNVAEGYEEWATYTAGDIQYLSKNSGSFIQLLTLLNVKSIQLDKVFSELPKVMLSTTNADVLTNNIGMSKMDPLRLGYVPVISWLPYHIGIAYAEWQNARRLAAQEEYQMLQFKLMELRQLDDGTSDPALKRRIEITQGRVESVQYRLAQLER